jgi:hypothetical protein
VKGTAAKGLIAEFDTVEEEAGTKVHAKLWGHLNTAVRSIPKSAVDVVVDAADFVGPVLDRS